MKPGELFALETTDYDSHDVVFMRALVEFTVDAEIAAWRGEVKDPNPRCQDLAARLVKRGRAEYVEHLSLEISRNDAGTGWTSLTPEADAREWVERQAKR